MLREASPSEDPAHSALFRALQRRRLHQVLWVMALAFAVLVVMNLSTQGYLSAGFELVMTGALALALRWNARGRLTQALVLTIVALLLGLCALTAIGQGLYDEALVAFPGLLLFAGLFGLRRTFMALLGCMIVVVVALFFLHQGDLLHSMPKLPMDWKIGRAHV